VGKSNSNSGYEKSILITVGVAMEGMWLLELDTKLHIWVEISERER
jgi:hypothetical protein